MGTVFVGQNIKNTRLNREGDGVRDGGRGRERGRGRGEGRGGEGEEGEGEGQLSNVKH